MINRDDLAELIGTLASDHIIGLLRDEQYAIADAILAAGYERLVNTEQVLFDAYAALAEAGLTEQQAFDAINELHNVRLLIRGRPEEA